MIWIYSGLATKYALKVRRANVLKICEVRVGKKSEIADWDVAGRCWWSLHLSFLVFDVNY